MVELQLADAPRLWALDQECFAEGIAYSREEIEAVLRAAGGFHRGIELGGELAAFILTLRRPRRGHVITVDVAPAHRRAGLGRQLLLASEEHYTRTGAVGMSLEAAVNNAAALQFYGRLGYRIERRLPGYYARDLDGLRMIKDF